MPQDNNNEVQEECEKREAFKSLLRRKSEALVDKQPDYLDENA